MMDAAAGTAGSTDSSLATVVTFTHSLSFGIVAFAFAFLAFVAVTGTSHPFLKFFPFLPFEAAKEDLEAASFTAAAAAAEAEAEAAEGLDLRATTAAE
jgi:hypothetical protein